MHLALGGSLQNRDVVRLLVCNGGDIYAENAEGKTPLGLVTNPALKADMVFLTRRPLLLFLEAVCVAEDLQSSLRRLAESSDLLRYMVRFV